ncbi:MAG: hypothetical protein AAB628_02440 [Patescibacteria group bacterium]
METLAKSDIFFFITSIAVIVLATVLVIAGYYLVQILKNFRDISNKLKKAVDVAEGDLENIHDQITQSWLYNFIFKKKRKVVKHKTPKP